MDKTSDNNIDSMDNGKMAEDRAGQQTANDAKADKSSKTDKDTASMNPLLDSDKTNKAGKSGNKNRKEQKKVNVEKTDDNDDKEKSDDEPLSLSEVIKEQATEEESPFARQFSLRKILGGDMLNTTFVRRQVWLLLLIAFFLIIYIANRYSCQQDIIEIDQLETQLKDAKYKALSSNSQLTEKCRESNVLEMLKNQKDSALKMPSQPPYLIEVPDDK